MDNNWEIDKREIEEDYIFYWDDVKEKKDNPEEEKETK